MPENLDAIKNLKEVDDASKKIWNDSFSIREKYYKGLKSDFQKILLEFNIQMVIN